MTFGTLGVGGCFGPKQLVPWYQLVRKTGNSKLFSLFSCILIQNFALCANFFAHVAREFAFFLPIYKKIGLCYLNVLPVIKMAENNHQNH